jgi:hypothetical protein
MGRAFPIAAGVAAGIVVVMVSACAAGPVSPPSSASGAAGYGTPAAADSAPAAATAPAAPSPSTALSYDPQGNIYPDPACTQIGGTTAEDLDGNAVCTQIGYLGSDGQTYYTSATVNSDGSLQGPADTQGTGATEQECATGQYPELDGAGPGQGQAGTWNAPLELCLP